ncbi:unnamed protein product [Prorocentrum cordatum]|uniref:Uncharacterized protein n=1 Tax=Prorocentrum cordatum TaxID=2364126 RepID=A0ABN9RN95_9DINO|nr:unnamed protein product [Polarella glacialis]
MARPRAPLAAAAVLALGLATARSLLFVASARPTATRRSAVAMRAKVWNPQTMSFEDYTGSAWENPTVEGMSSAMGLYFPEMKPEKPKKGYYYNRAWKKVEANGPNDPTTAGLPGWDIETNIAGERSFEQEQTYGWNIGPGTDNVDERPVR